MNRFSSLLVSRLLLVTLLATGGLAGSLRAATVSGSGYTNSFTAQPPAADWSTYSIAGAAADNGTIAALDTSVNTISAATIIATQTAPIAMDPPDFNGVATWSSSGLYLQTRPTGNGATLLMCTLVNNLGFDPGVVNVSYDLAEPVIAGEAFEGHRGYYSRTGAAGSWIPVPDLAFPMPGRVVANIDVSWPNGTTLYLLWADDNGGPSPDTTVQMDNFSVKRGVVTPVNIVLQPQSQTVIAGLPATNTVLATGTSPTYQWQRESPAGSGVFVNIAGAAATSSNYVLNPALITSAGLYRAIVGNSLGSVTSSVANLTVVLDRFGPRMISAQVVDGNSNQIRLQWDERLTPATANSTANYVITPVGSTNRVPISTAVFNLGALQTTLSIPTNSGTTVTNNWYIGGNTNYILTVNNIRDISPSNNVVAPNSQIAIGWPLRTNVFPVSQVWQFHNNWFFETNIYDTPWYNTNYTGLDSWGSDFGPFFHDLFPAASCFGDLNWTSIGYQRQPTLFRTWFNWPAGSSTNANLRLQFSVDDGAVFYLNGTEIPGSRYNAPAGPVTATSRSSGDLEPSCNTNQFTVSNLRPGTSNLFAVAVYQSSDTAQNDIFFVMQMDVVSFRTPSQPTNALPITIDHLAHFNIFKTNEYMRFDWKANGYALESTIVPFGMKTNNISSYKGPWFEVQPNMTNPFTNALATNALAGDNYRIYRLHKVNHGTP